MNVEVKLMWFDRTRDLSQQGGIMGKKVRLMDQFVLAESQEELDRVDHLVNESWKTKDKGAKGDVLRQMRSIMKFEAFVGFNETYKAVALWRAISRRKLTLQRRGIVVGTRVRNPVVWNRTPGVVTEIRDDFVLKVLLDDESRTTMSPHDVELIS